MPDYIRQPTRRTITCHPGLVWIEQNRAVLLDNHWVAASAKGLVAQKERIDELMADIASQHINPAEVAAIAFITADVV